MLLTGYWPAPAGTGRAPGSSRYRTIDIPIGTN